MRVFGRYIILFFVLFLSLHNTAAAQVNENNPNATQANDGRRDTVFNALDYSMQRRYLERGLRFENAGLFENSFVFLSGGVSQGFKDANTSYTMGPNLGVGAGLWFDHEHGVSAAAYAGSYKTTVDSTEYEYIGADVSYRFNFTSNMAWYPNDVSNVVLVMGAGFRKAESSAVSNYSVGAHLGLNFDLKIYKGLYMFFQPMIYYNFKAEPRGVYSLNYGLCYNFMPKAYREYLASGASRGSRGSDGSGGYDGSVGSLDVYGNEGNFVSVMGGLQTHIADITSESVGFKNSLGPHAGVAYGKWYGNLFAIRIGGFYSKNTYAEYLESYKYETQYYGARVEAAFEFLHYIPNNKYVRFAILAGPEFGYISKTDIDEQIKSMYLGVTAATQLKVRVYRGLSVLLEPRISLVPYNFKPSVNIATEHKLVNYADKIANLSFGVEYNW